jgi:transcriptional regulator with XRE-family HTH domain
VNIREARRMLKLSQREMIAYAKTARFELTQTALSNMENGKSPVDERYARWLGFRIMDRYKRVADMPVGILAECIKNREEYE